MRCTTSSLCDKWGWLRRSAKRKRFEVSMLAVLRGCSKLQTPMCLAFVAIQEHAAPIANNAGTGGTKQFDTKEETHFKSRPKRKLAQIVHESWQCAPFLHTYPWQWCKARRSS
eukprot:156780-Amphidinium_carterae.1